MNTKNYKKNKTSQMKTVGKTSKPKIDKNQLLAIILACLIIFWTVASVFGFIGYARSKKSTANCGVISASAMTVDEIRNDKFVIEDIMLQGLSLYVDNGNSFTLGYLDIVFEHNTLYLDTGSDVFVFGGSSPSGTISIYSFYNNAGAVSYGGNSFQVVSSISSTSIPERWDFASFSEIYITYSFSTQTNYFHIDMTLQILSNGSMLHEFEWTLRKAISYSNLQSCYFFIPARSQPRPLNNPLGLNLVPVAGPSYNDFARYYSLYSTLSPDAIVTYEFGFEAGRNQGYNEGFAVGKENGKAEGLQQGYANGMADGDAIGYERGLAEGRQQGLNDSNAYTFDKLLSSVIDVPIRAFRGLFDFEILGINLSKFFFSLLSLAIVLAVVRMVL